MLTPCAQDIGGIVERAERLMAGDVKDPHLKLLQAAVMQEAWADGTLTAPVYPDAVANLRKWHAMNIPVAIYSSGAVSAQKMFFGHVRDVGSLLDVFDGRHFDTVNAGPKKEAQSYRKIQETLGAKNPLFLSDSHEEVEAAMDAGWKAMAVVRPGNVPLPEGWSNAPIIHSFDEVKL